MDLSLFSFLLVSLTTITFLLIIKHLSSPKQTSSPSILNGYPLVGNMPRFIKNQDRFLEWCTELVLASPTGTVTVAPIVFTADPAVVEHVTRSRFENYPKVYGIVEAFKDFIGDGIFNADGKSWMVQRKSASYEFSTKSLRAFVHERVQKEITTRLIPVLIRASRTGKIVDLQDILEHFAFDNICSLVLDYDPKCLGEERNEEGERLLRAFEEASEMCCERAKNHSVIWRLKEWIYGSSRKLNNSVFILRDKIDKCLKSRKNKASGSHQADFLSRFVDEGTHSDELIRDLLISFMIAGDTTPSGMTWFFWVLSCHPDVVSKIRDDVETVRKDRDQLGLDELREMNYLHAAISESLRLYPPVSMLPRICKEEDILPDRTTVRKGWVVMYSAYAMGRSRRLWGNDCEEFKPERWFENEGLRQVNSFVYPVFHAGPRMCLGKEMAYIQIKAVVASVLERFDIELVASGRLKVSITTKMEGGLKVRFKERTSN
ncbi:hypothetical protein LUZ60_011889 [Juncus effusus]|nr:hypothetical protein LUZ60_011889 [Juncus effusus]